MALATGNPQTATIVVTDLVGSTELRVRVGEERAELLRRLHDRLIAAEITSRNGTVVKGLGDGVLAMFAGAADAVAAAVAIQQSMVMHNRRSREAHLSVRIGISAGDVTLEDGDCFGAPVVEASRLCARADGGQVLVADLIRLLARGRGDHDFNQLGDLELKGLPDPVATAEVVWDDAVSSAIPLPAPLSVGEWYPFAGRASEVEALGLRWKEAVAEGLRVVALSGEPGMGKTRMSTELARNVHAEGAVVLYGRCDEELDTPYRPFAEALRHLVAHVPDTLLNAHVAAVGSILSGIVPELCRRVDCENAAHADSDRNRLFNAVLDLLERAAEDAPVLLVLDDLHWADRSSLLLLRHLVSEGGELPLLVVGTYRDTDLSRTHPLAAALADLRRNPIVERISLEGLAVDEVASFLNAAAGSGEVDVPGLSRLAEILYTETEGNPFFLSEVLSHLLESGAIYQENGRWVGNRALIAQLGVPEGVREVLGRRLSALSDVANEALTVAAVIGHEFVLPVLADVIGVEADELVERLDEAVERRLIEEAPQSFDTFRFSHALVRQTLCEELTTSRRVRLHRKVAHALEARGGTVEQLAHHFGEAAVMGEEEKALDYARAAGDEAMERIAYEQAVGWYGKALEMDESLDPDPARRCALLLCFGKARNCAGETLEARESFIEAFDLAQATGDASAAATAACEYGGESAVWIDATDTTGRRLIDGALAMQPDGAVTATRLELLAAKSHWLTLVPGSSAERQALAQEAVAISEHLENPLHRMRALTAHAETMRGRVGVGPSLVAIGRELIEKGSHSAPAAAYGRWILAGGQVVLNDLDGFAETIEAQRQEGEKARSWQWLWGSAAMASNLAIMRGEFDRVEELIERERQLASPLGETAVVIAYVHEIQTAEQLGDYERALALYERERQMPIMASAWLDIPIALLRGETDEARELIRRSWAALEVVLPDEFRLNAIAHHARYAVRTGMEDLYEPTYERLLPAAGTWISISPEVHAAHCDQLLGELARAMGRDEDAERHLRAAVAAMDASGARPYLADALVDLARLLGRTDEAGTLLARADAIADELSLVPVQRRIEKTAAARPAVAVLGES